MRRAAHDDHAAAHTIVAGGTEGNAGSDVWQQQPLASRLALVTFKCLCGAILLRRLGEPLSLAATEFQTIGLSTGLLFGSGPGLAGPLQIDDFAHHPTRLLEPTAQKLAREASLVGPGPPVKQIAGQLDDTIGPYYQVTMNRIQTGVRMDASLLKVLKALAEYKDMGLGDLLEGIVLHAFDGKAPFDATTSAVIVKLRDVYGCRWTSANSHLHPEE